MTGRDGKEPMVWLDATAALHGERAIRRHTYNLLNALVARNRFRYGVLYFDRRGNTPGRLALPPGSGVREIVIRWPVRLLVPAWERLAEPCLERFVGKVDLLYAPDLYFPPLCRGRVLSTVRGVAYMKEGELLDPRHRRKLVRAFAYARARSHGFVAVSESTRRDLLQCTDIPESRIFVVTHGVDERFRPMVRAEAHRRVEERFGLRHPYLLYVGAVAVHKNVPGLLEAFLAVAARDNLLHLVLAGPEETAAASVRQRTQSADVAHRVHLLGPIEQESDALTALYSAAEAFVFPTFYEGWCAPPLEAMACGTPVICSNVPAVVEAVGDAALLVAPHDHRQIGDAVMRVLKDGALRTCLVKKGRHHVESHTWVRSARTMEEVFRHMLNFH